MYGVCADFFFLLRTPRAETGFIVDLHCRVVAPVACNAVKIRSSDDNCYD